MLSAYTLSSNQIYLSEHRKVYRFQELEACTIAQRGTGKRASDLVREKYGFLHSLSSLIYHQSYSNFQTLTPAFRYPQAPL